MWVFGYGSLIWDNWEINFSCTRKLLAELNGYSRTFNKASIKNWGTKEAPCPTLNIEAAAGAICRGIAFEFPDAKKAEVLTYLKKREGKGFPLFEMLVRLPDASEVFAFIPIYTGMNLISEKSLPEIAKMVAQTTGQQGKCTTYVRNIAQQLNNLGINDPVVIALLNQLENARV